jgi:hypothetical protein
MRSFIDKRLNSVLLIVIQAIDMIPFLSMDMRISILEPYVMHSWFPSSLSALPEPCSM